METETLPKSYLSEAEREEIRRDGGSQNFIYLEEAVAAREADDLETYWSWLAMSEGPAHSLMFLKKRRGAEFIRHYGFNTAEADRVYGADWLDR